ncbi:MAG: hypothetical protein ABJA77_05080 [Variovorax sp.]
MEQTATAQPIVDLEALVSDLRLVCAYAAKAGLMTEDLLAASDRADQALLDPQRRDAKPVLAALSLGAQRIAPMTVADLKFRRDPFLPENQQRGRVAQFWLASFALVVLGFLVVYMLALQSEQDALANIEQVQRLNARQKLSALRRMAQDKQLTERTALQEQYREKVVELAFIYGRIVNSYGQSRAAADMTLNPVIGLHKAWQDWIATFTATDKGAPTLAPSPDPDLCLGGDDGDFRPPKNITQLPPWLQTAVKDDVADFCFLINVVGRDQLASNIDSQIQEQLTMAPQIKFNASARVQWILPFLYGLLGATVFMMRHVASVRTPAVEWFPMFMRVTLGGVAGIVIGWFSSTNGSASLQGASSLSLPFAAAFVTGYGIDVLFSMLDRVTRLIGSPTVPATGAERSASAG